MNIVFNGNYKYESQIGKNLSSINTPSFVVDLSIFKRNCKKMIDLCNGMKIELRSQTKTHKTIEGADIQTNGTKKCLVTSTLVECEFYADNGFEDILFGFPLCVHHMPKILNLVKRLQKFHVLIDSLNILRHLVDTTPPSGKSWSVFIKIDCGNGRAGFSWTSDSILEAAKIMHECGHILMKGLYIHCGNSYTTASVADVRDQTIEMVLSIKQKLLDSGYTCSVIGIGSTPTCSQPGNNMKDLNELHPGNYVFYDVQQYQRGSCLLDEIACFIATRVIGHYPDRNQLLIDCGFNALTNQGWGCMDTGYCVFKGENNLKLEKMTQEIGFVKACSGSLEFDKYPVGYVLLLYPYHSCATAAMHPVYLVIADNIVKEEWYPVRGW